jgi:diguanylate cyclase (GGDEF)-like protein/PAS domain S-box-containing protein
MADGVLRIHVCANFAPDVRAALPEHLGSSVRVVEFASECAGPHAACIEHCEHVHDPAAARTQLTTGDTQVTLSHQPDGDDVCALRCTGPAGYRIVNREIAEQLVAEGAYLLTPGWVRRWPSYLRAQGFDRHLGRQYFHEFASHLVLLDTGTDPQALQQLHDMGRFLDLPTRRLPCGLDYLRLFLTDLVLEWRLYAQTIARDDADGLAAARQADYAVTLDMLGTLTGLTEVGEVAERVLDLMTMLFAPGRLRLLIIESGRPGELYSRPAASAEDARMVSTSLAALGEGFALTDDGFLLLVGDGDERAAVELGAFVRPDKRDDYLNLALTLAGAFDLALANARSFGRLERARQELRASEARYRALMEQAADAIVLVDVNGTVLEANGQALRLMGKRRDEVVGHPAESLHAATIRHAVQRGMERLVRDGIVAADGLRLTRPDGEEVVIDARFSMVDVAGRRIAQGIFRDVTERERSARELEALSLEDALTGLRNRRGFLMLAEQEIKTAARLGRRLLLLYADVDGLKPVNDQQGHGAGDQLLKDAAGVLSGCFREMDVVARVGGDEFAVLQIDAGPESEASSRRRLEQATTTVNAAPGRRYRLSLSLGAASFDPAAPLELDELLRLADERMYADKRAGRMDDVDPRAGR